jgi:hypothetical protein
MQRLSAVSFKCASRAFMSIQALQQTGHANNACSCHSGFPRVSRLLSWLFGEGGSMFEWLDRELAEIRTKRFHMVDGPASAAFRVSLLASPLPAPPSYVQFVLRFGNAKLYRMIGLDLYWLRIFAAPHEVESRTGEPLLYIGGYDESCAYLREETLGPGTEAPIFESTQTGVRKAANSFAEWLMARAVRARRRYKRKEWVEVMRGPPPFTKQELAVVEARRKYAWRVIGVAPSGEIMYEVSNGSDRQLPFLSVGIRGRTGKLQGGVWLPVGHIAPGQTVVVLKDTYRDLLDPSDVEAYQLPDPEPEERARYWEFRSITGVASDSAEQGAADVTFDVKSVPRDDGR